VSGFRRATDGETAEARLRGLPFAVRCRACERRCEEAQADAKRRPAQHAGSLFLPALTV